MEWGEAHVWAVANALLSCGVHVYLAKFAETEDWQTAWFGRLGRATTVCCVCLVSAEYMRSAKCRRELYEACKEDKINIAAMFGPPPEGFLRDEGWFASGTVATQHEVNAGILIRQRLTNLIPPPSDGYFMDDWPSNISRLLHRVQVALSDRARADACALAADQSLSDEHI